MDHFSRLSLDQLVHLLSHVDIKPRLSSCSLVSSTWRTAAARATTSIRVDDHTFLASFEQWLWAHTVEVQVSSLTVLRNIDLSLKLPVAQLQRLQDLELQHVEWSPSTESAGAEMPPLQAVTSASSSSRLQPLAALTALTRLALTGSSVRLAGLSALTGLQELYCQAPYGVAVWHADSAIWALAEADLVAAFPQLQRLTSLTLRGDITSTAMLSQLSTLQSLQQLQVYPNSVEGLALPRSLTQLHLMPQSASSFTASTAAGLSQLTALQSLHLYHVVPLDLSLLAGMRDLRSLQLFVCEPASGGPRLQVVSRFTALTSLNIGVYHALADQPAFPSITAAEAGALTSSSQLAELALYDPGVELQLQDYASLFPPGRQLQHLTKLVLSADLLSDPTAVRQAGSCCPNLQHLLLGSSRASYLTHWEVGEAAAVAGWSSLRELRLTEPWQQLPPPLWQALGTLSQLTGLDMLMPEAAAADDDVLHLTGCKSLKRLSICSKDGCRMRHLQLDSKAPPGAPSDVWAQLPQELERLAAT